MTTQPHSEAFIQDMKAKLEEELKRLRPELGAIAHPHDGKIQADFPDYGRNDEENANEMADYQALSGTAAAIEARLKEVEAALVRIEQGIYGVTPEGEVIPENRLRANPAANTLVS